MSSAAEETGEADENGNPIGERIPEDAAEDQGHRLLKTPTPQTLPRADDRP